MFSDDEDLNLLTQVGFTKTQAKLYLALLKLGKIDGKTLSKNANTPRTVVYRTLDELQKMGLVEKEVIVPYKFKATPLKQGLQILMAQKLQQYEESRAKTEKLLLKNPDYSEEPFQEDEYKFNIIQGKERIIQKIHSHHNNVQQTVCIISTSSRWLQIIHYCLESHINALKRGVKYRVVVEKTQQKIEFSADVQSLLAEPNFELKLTPSSPPTNMAIFDNKEAAFNVYPSKLIAESPIIWTNNPGFLAMCQDHFKRLWKASRKYPLE